MELSKRVSTLRGSPTLQAAENVRRLLSEGEDVVRFDIGEPDFDTPAHIKQAGIEAIMKGFTHYTSARGIPELREALVMDQKTKGLELGTSNLVFYPGSKIALFSILSLLVDDGDEVIIQDPVWPTYASIIEYLGGIPVRITSWRDDENQSNFPIDAFEAHVSEKTKAVLINSPCNPTGAVVDEGAISELMGICERKHIQLILDRIYSALSYDSLRDQLPSSCDIEQGNLIIVSGFSKEFAMTGWRLGYTIASRAFTNLLVNFEDNTATCAPSFVQKAAVSALNGERSWQLEMNQEYQERRDVMVNQINAIPGWKCAKPAGAFYCFPTINTRDSASYAESLLQKKRVSSVAGVCFGPSGEGHLRLSYTTPVSRIIEGMERIREFVVNSEAIAA